MFIYSDKDIKLLDKLQEKARVRTYSINAIERVCQRLDKEIKELLPVSYANGIKVLIGTQDFPHAYRGTPEGTVITLKKVKNGWRIDEARRGNCRKRSKDGQFFNFTDKQKEAIIEKAVKRIKDLPCFEKAR